MGRKPKRFRCSDECRAVLVYAGSVTSRLAPLHFPARCDGCPVATAYARATDLARDDRPIPAEAALK